MEKQNKLTSQKTPLTLTQSLTGILKRAGTLDSSDQKQAEAFSWSLIRIEQEVSLTKAVADRSKSLRSLLQEVDKVTLISNIAKFIKFACDQSYNVPEKLTIMQAVSFAQKLIEFHGLTIEDVVVFCKEMKCGSLGKIYNRIDLSVLNDFFDVYLEMRIDEVEARERSKKADHMISAERANSIIGMSKIGNIKY